MKRKPIKAECMGCGSYSVNYSKIPQDYIFNGGGVQFYTVKINDRCIELDGISLEDVFEKYKKDFKNAELVEIQFMTSLHYETYELCKESNQFLLVEQRQGYA